MKRHDFLLLAGVISAAWTPALAEVKIQAGARQENQSLLDAFGEHLSALGWTIRSKCSM